MKLKTNKTLTVEVTVEEIETLLKRLVEKKTGKKVESLDLPDACRGVVWKFALAEEAEEANLDDTKEPKV